MSARRRSSPRPAKKGAVTIATNMAGRGTDIMLGGNVTYMAKATLRKELERGIQQKQEDAEASYKAARIAAKAAGEPLPEKPAPIDYTARLDELLTEGRRPRRHDRRRDPGRTPPL